MHIEVIGVYPVRAPEPCHLIELWVRALDGELDVGRFTQEIPGRAQANWQVPYDERLLNEHGTASVAEPFPDRVSGKGDLRIAFFFHYLELSRPLSSPAGPLKLPEPSESPSRLRFFEYEPPC
jgi:hypothetical protein